MSDINNLPGTVGTVTSVAHLDLERYVGLWYEIGRLPMRHEDDTASDVTAHYSAVDGEVMVDNRSFDDEGKPQQAIGKAAPVADHPGSLKLTFLPAGLRWIPFTEADYWVLKLDSSYLHALVGTPDHKYLWLLSRESEMDPMVMREYFAEAEHQGFDLTDWIRTPQSGGRVLDHMLD